MNYLEWKGYTGSITLKIHKFPHDPSTGARHPLSDVSLEPSSVRPFFPLFSYGVQHNQSLPRVDFDLFGLYTCV